MKRLNVAAAFLLILVAQVVLLPYLAVRGIQPDLTIFTAYAVGVRWGFPRGMLAGGVLGLLVDIAGGVAVGVFMLSGMVVGTAAGVMGAQVFRPTPGVHAAGLLGVSLLGGTTTLVLVQILYAAYEWIDGLAAIVVPQALYTTALGLPALLLFGKWMEKRARRERAQAENLA